MSAGQGERSPGGAPRAIAKTSTSVQEHSSRRLEVARRRVSDALSASLLAEAALRAACDDLVAAEKMGVES